MNIEYELNTDDMVEFNVFSLDHHPQIKKRRKIMHVSFISLIVLILAGGLVQYFVGSDSSLAILLIVIGLGLAVFYWYSTRPARTKKNIRKAVIRQARKIPKEEICRRKLTISEEGLRVVTAYEDSNILWSAFSEIVQTDKYLYLFFQPEKAHIVPRRAFNSDAAFSRFADTAMDYFKKANK